MFQKEFIKIKQVHQKKLCHCWLFKDVGFKFEKHIFNASHNLLTMGHSLKI